MSNLTTLKFLRRDDWWDNYKMRAKKNIAKVEDVRYLRPLLPCGSKLM